METWLKVPPERLEAELNNLSWSCRKIAGADTLPVHHRPNCEADHHADGDVPLALRGVHLTRATWQTASLRRRRSPGRVPRSSTPCRR